jgi:phospholipid/cholesterol/gamma-HCH transport system substrate-binding protein
MKISNELKTGILGLLAVVIFFFGFSFLKGNGFFSSKNTVKAKYSNVQGLTPASYVQVNGMNVGTVTDITFNEEDINEIVVSMAIDNEVKLPKDTRAIIISNGLIGNKVVRLDIGQSKEILASNDFVIGELEVGMMDKLGNSVQPVVANVEKTIASLDTVMTSIKNVLNEETQRNLQSAVADVSTSMRDINLLAKELSQQKGKVTNMMNNLNSFTNNLDKNNQSITNIVKNAELTTSKLSKVEIEQTVKKLEKTLLELETTLAKINSGNGSMALLMNDDKLYNNVKNTMATVNNLLYDISARPKRYINFSVFGRKNKDDSPPPPAPNSTK